MKNVCLKTAPAAAVVPVFSPKSLSRKRAGGLARSFGWLASLLLGVGTFFFSDPARAANYTWNVQDSGYWENSISWGGSYPTLSDSVTVTNPGNGTFNNLIVAPPSGSFPSWTGTGQYNSLTMNSAYAQSVNLTVYSMLLGGDATLGNNANVLVDSGTWVNLGGITLSGTKSSFTVTDRGVASSNAASIGSGVGATGTATVTNGSYWHNDATLFVGLNSGSGLLQVANSGTLNVDGGITLASGATNSVGTVAIFGTSGSQGVVTAYSVVDSVGSGTLIFDGGILRAKRNDTNFISGFAAGGLGISNNGAYLDSNGFNVTVSSGFVGQGGLAKQGLGTLTLSGSNFYGGNTLVQTGTLAVSGSTGVLNSPSGTLAIGANPGENGSLLINSGGRVVAAGAFVGSSAGSTGSVTVASGSLGIAGSLSAGAVGLGTFTVSGGTASNGNAFFGSSTGTGNVTVSAGSWVNTNDLYYGRGTLSISGGSVTTAGNSILAAYQNAGTVLASVSGGTWDTTGYLIVGYAASGSLQINGGSVIARTGVIVGYDTPGNGVVTLSSGTLATTFMLRQNGGVGKVNLDGGTLRALASQSDFLSGFGAGAVTLGGNTTIDTNGQAIGINSSLSGTGGFRVSGGGSLTLTGSHSFTGQATVDGGTLLVNGDISSSLRTFVEAQSTLGGTGKLSDVHVADLGTLTAGTATGTGLLVINGDLLMDIDSTLSLQFSGTGAGAFDQLAVSGAFSATGVNLSLDVNYAALLGDSFQVFTGATAGASSFNITSNLGGGLYWDASQLGSAGILTVVPEPGPSSLVLLSLSSLAYGIRRVRSKRS